MALAAAAASRGRLARTHGDFHPFNVRVRAGRARRGRTATSRSLDASRGGKGDPADDLTALSMNYVFFAAEHRARVGARRSGRSGRRFWDTLPRRRPATARSLETAPPFLAWRALVVASPRFYPGLGAPARDLLLGLAERALDAGRLELDLPDRAPRGRAA